MEFLQKVEAVRMGDKRSTERNQKEFILNKRSPFIVQEAYKALRTNVTFSLTESSGGACIGVTSASRGEGKSTTTMNLAISYAQITSNANVRQYVTRAYGRAFSTDTFSLKNA